MRFSQMMRRWQGIGLTLIGCVSALWLAHAGKLQLYIHPRYITFTVLLSCIGVLLALVSFCYRPQHNNLAHGRLQVLVSAGVLVVCLVAFTALLIVRPAPLTSSSLQQRGINSGISSGVHTTNAVPLFGGSDYTQFGVREWAGLLVQTNDPDFYKGKSANISGFISPEESDPENVLYVSRFVVTCCAVDARPIGVPVYVPGWQALYKTDAWIQVAGDFIANPSAKSKQRVVIRPTSIVGIVQPKDPYVY